jgi:hypothetical protein
VWRCATPAALLRGSSINWARFRGCEMHQFLRSKLRNLHWLGSACQACSHLPACFLLLWPRGLLAISREAVAASFRQDLSCRMAFLRSLRIPSRPAHRPVCSRPELRAVRVLRATRCARKLGRTLLEDRPQVGTVRYQNAKADCDIGVRWHLGVQPRRVACQSCFRSRALTARIGAPSFNCLISAWTLSMWACTFCWEVEIESKLYEDSTSACCGFGFAASAK